MPLQEMLYPTITLFFLLLSLGLGGMLYRSTRGLRSGKEIFSQFFEKAPLLICISRLKDGVILDVNLMFSRNTGYRREEVLGSSLPELGLVSEDDYQQMLSAVAENRGLEGFDFCLHTRNGSLRHCRSYCQIAPVGGQTCLVFMGLDLTKKRQLEDARRQAENFHQVIIDNISDPVFVKDQQHRFALVNQAFCDLCGRDAEEILGRADEDFFPPEQTRHFRTIDNQVFAKRNKQDSEETISNHRGELRTAVIRKNFFTLAEEQKFLVGVIHDITEQRKIEAQLNKFGHMVAQSPVSIVVTDISGKIEFVNPKFTQMTGYTSAEACGQNPRILKSGLTPKATYRQLWEALTQGQVWEGEFLNKARNGSLFWEHATISPLRDEAGMTTHYLAIKEDISEKKSLQERLHHSEKIDSIGRLASGVSHDFNNMLAVISGNVELAMQREASGKPAEKYLRQIKDATERSAELTRQLLTFARKQEIKPVSMELNSKITQTLKFLKRLIGEDIELVWQPGDSELYIFMDPSQLDQILTNLVVNARDAIATTGTLSLTTQHLCPHDLPAPPDAKRDYVRLSVADSGCGMSTTLQQQVFEPFFTTKPEGKGTGIGLSTVYGIVKQNDGHIHIQSQPGQGTIVQIDLPMSTPQSLPSQPREKSTQPGGQEKILLVEDEPSFLKTCQSMLESFGYQVIATSDPIAAMNLAKEHKDSLQLLLTDVIMPKINGQELANALKLDNSELKVLFMSGYTLDIVTNRGLLDNEVVHLQKPFTSAALAEKIHETLNK